MSKLIVQKINTQTDGSIKDHQYGIGDIGLVLEILRNKLYRDPILAVVREYVTNARDAHVEVGKADAPVVVTLPTRDDPYFKVQDFGPGLSPERIENIFCNYASSTKRNSEEQVGYFGIGSKSAFAYSDSFSIISVVDGVIRTYQSYIDETRKGKISCLYEAVSDQPNGTTIIIPVKRYDYEKFEEKLIEITEFWDVRPTVYSNNKLASLSYRNETTVFSGNDWKLNRYEGYHTRTTCAIMGGIAYPIDMGQFDNHPARSFFQYSALRIYFNNSDLSLAASRDSLHYDSRTIKAITSKFNNIVSEINSKIENQIQNELSYADALLKFNSALNSNPELTKIVFDLKYQDKLIFRNPKIAFLGKNAKITWYSKVLLNNNIWDYKVKTVNFKSLNNDGDFCNILSSNENCLIFNNISVPDYKKYALSVFNSNSTLKNVAILTLADDKDATETHPHFWFANEVSHYNITDIVPYKISKSYSKKSLSNKDNYFLYKFCSKTSRADRGKKTVEVSPFEDIVYFIFDNKTNYPVDESSNIFSELDYFESILQKRIYGIPASKTKDIPDNWISLKQALNCKYEEYLKESGCISTLDLIETIAAERQTFKSKNYSPSGITNLLAEQLNKDNIIGKYYWESLKLEDKMNKIHNLRHLESLMKYTCNYDGSYYNVSDGPGTIFYKLNQMNEEMHKKYPLIKHVIRSWDANSGSVECKHLNDYINMVDLKSIIND